MRLPPKTPGVEAVEPRIPKGPDHSVIRMDDTIDALGERDGWSAEEYAARVHYQGDGDRYSIEYYRPSNCVLYWRVKGDGETAVPVGRDTVPEPLRRRIRLDLEAAGIDPDTEGNTL